MYYVSDPGCKRLCIQAFHKIGWMLVTIDTIQGVPQLSTSGFIVTNVDQIA